MTPRGGKREGAGRPKELEDAVDVTVRLSRAHVQMVDDWAAFAGWDSRSAAIRDMIQRAWYETVFASEPLGPNPLKPSRE